MRHKYLTTLDIEWYPFEDKPSVSIFEWMYDEGLVAEKYEYSTKNENIGGNVFIQKIAGEENFVIATNQYITYSNGYGRLRKYRRYRVMFKLNEVGIKWVKQQLLERNV